MNVSTLPRDSRAWVEVDVASLLANARTVQAAAGASLLPMVKANGYGLGIRVVHTLERVKPWGYGVATVDEAVELRGQDIRRPIVVFTPATLEHLSVYREHDLRAVLDTPETIAAWPLPFHVEIDTGMGRCGLRWDDPGVSAISSNQMEGVFTHFLAADEQPDTVARQWSRFEAALANLTVRPALVHAANSAGAWRLERKTDLVRPGIFLYGGLAGSGLPTPNAVVSLRARIVSLRHVCEGETVSYGGEWTARSDGVVATVGIGYADGVCRSVQGRGHVIVRGVRYPIVGRVTMDFVMIDLSSNPSAIGVNDVATLIGRDGREEITLDEVADWAGTISYEILTGLGQRLPREYLGG